MADNQTSNPQFGEPLLQRFFLSPQEKQDKEKGKAIIKNFYTLQTTANTSGTGLNFFTARSARFQVIRQWMKGTQNMQEFLDYMNISDANKAWVNIDTTPSRIAVQFINTVLEAMAKYRTYACVDAIDDGSLNEKEDRLFESLFRMNEVETINDIQQQTAIQVEPTNAYVPDDEMSARVYYEIEDKLPKEIRFEEYLASVMDDIGFESTANRKTLHDLAGLNIAVVKIERLGKGNYAPRVCVPDNTVYNFFMNDSGEYEITEIGEFYCIKVKDVRRDFGKTAERPNGLTEQEIYDLAKYSGNKNIGTMGIPVFGYQWNNNYGMDYLQNRPYDDANILVFDCRINFSEDQYYVSKKDKYGKENIQKKSSIPYQQKSKDGVIIEQPKPDDVEILKSTKPTWMKGVYAPYGDKLLFWGNQDLIIQDYNNPAKQYSEYTVVIPGNDGSYIPSLFERIMEPLKEYQIAKLKRKQLIAKLTGAGYRIDIESARNIDLGNGDTISWEEVVRIKDQTFVEVWSSKGLDPLQQAAPPFSPATQDDTIQKIIGLTNVLAGIMQEIRTLIGSSMYLEGGDLGDRTAASLAKNQVEQSNNVFGYVVNFNNKLWEDVFHKLTLLKWTDIVKTEPESKEDLINTRFKTSVKMKSTDYQKQLLEQDIQRYSQVVDAQGNPAITPKDAMFLREIDNDRLARWYLATTIEKNKKNAMEESRKNQEMNAQVQQQSAQQASQQAMQLQQDKLASEKDMVEFTSTKKKEEIFLQGYLAAAAKDPTLLGQFMPIIKQLIPNISVPLSMENEQMSQAISAQAQQEQMAAQQGQEPPAQEQQEQPQEAPQQEQAESQMM